MVIRNGSAVCQATAGEVDPGRDRGATTGMACRVGEELRLGAVIAGDRDSARLGC